MTVDYPVNGTDFEYNNKLYSCSHAIKRDIKMILQEAETSHKDSFDAYDKETLKPKTIRLFLDDKKEPVFGMVLYTIHNKEENYNRYACGGYYPFYNEILSPHGYQESICW